MLKKKKSGFRGAKRHSQKLKKKIEYVIRRHGYHDCASFVLAKAAGDVVFYFWMESPPSGLVFVYICMYPVFMPPTEVLKCCVYGDRIKSYFANTGSFAEDDGFLTTARKLFMLDIHIGKEIESAAKRMSKEKTFIETFSRLRKGSSLRYKSSKDYRLLMYHALYHKEYSNAVRFADEYLGLMHSSGYTPNLIEEAESEVRHIKDMIESKDHQAIEAMLEGYRKQNAERYKL